MIWYISNFLDKQTGERTREKYCNIKVEDFRVKVGDILEISFDKGLYITFDEVLDIEKGYNYYTVETKSSFIFFEGVERMVKCESCRYNQKYKNMCFMTNCETSNEMKYCHLYEEFSDKSDLISTLSDMVYQCRNTQEIEDIFDDTIRGILEFKKGVLNDL